MGLLSKSPIIGFSGSPGRQVRLIGLIAENVRCYGSGLPLMNVVHKVRGY